MARVTKADLLAQLEEVEKQRAELSGLVSQLTSEKQAAVNQLSIMTAEQDELVTERDDLTTEVESLTEGAEMYAERLRVQAETNRRLSSDLENMHDECRQYQESNSSLRRQLREEQKAHQKTRDKVKTAPRIRIESPALIEMSKTGKDADSNLSEMFGDCDVTVTAPKKEERRPRRGVEDLMSRLGRESGMRRSSPITDMISSVIAAELNKTGETECPVCHGTNPFCAVDEMLQTMSTGSSMEVPSDCVHGGPSTDCEFCPENCRYKGMPAELAEVIGARTEDGSSVFDDILFMSVSEGKDSRSGSFTMSDILGRGPGRTRERHHHPGM